MNRFKNIIFLSWLFMTPFFCNQTKSKESYAHLDKAYSQVELYCFCLKEIDNVNTKIILDNCATVYSIKPKELIKSKYLFDSTSDNFKVKSLQNYFFVKAKDSIRISEPNDSRLIILFRVSSTVADTIVYNSADKFTLNGRLQLSYPFQILDSVKTIMGIENFTCYSGQ